jgi:transmembrane sensor
MNSNQLPQDDIEFDEVHRTAYLISAYIQHKLTPAEREELDDWVAASKENLLLFEELSDDKQLKKTLHWFHKLDIEKAKRRVHQKMNVEPVRPLWQKIMPYMVAACFILIVGTMWFYQRQEDKRPNLSKRPPTAEPVPGGNKAILTLADGRHIVLDSAANGSLGKDGASAIIKSDSVLTYEVAEASSGHQAAYNMIEVPKSGKYQIVLSDGTKVWLNAASSLRFPAAFTGKERRVELTGEGYFEVAKNKGMPFHVSADGVDIAVLGTHFNIQAYSDESAIKATLLEGSVQVSNNSSKAVLKPGEQAQIKNEGGLQDITIVKNADMEKVVGWRNGLFIFRDDDVKDIMKALESWYDIKVIYKANINRHLSGTFYRSEPLNNILHYLEGTNEVHFEIKGKDVMVLP